MGVLLELMKINQKNKTGYRHKLYQSIETNRNIYLENIHHTLKITMS